jgi:hypothetical protein
MKGEPFHRASPPDDDPPSPERVAQERLARENTELRQRLRHVEGALRCAARTLQPYAADRKR